MIYFILNSGGWWWYQTTHHPPSPPPKNWQLALTIQKQGGHATGKTGNLAVNFSRQGKHREFSKFNFLHRENCGNLVIQDNFSTNVSFKEKVCQVFDSYVRSSNYALLAIAKMPNNELTSIHTLSLPPLHL